MNDCVEIIESEDYCSPTLVLHQKIFGALGDVLQHSVKVYDRLTDIKGYQRLGDNLNDAQLMRFENKITEMFFPVKFYHNETMTSLIKKIKKGGN